MADGAFADCSQLTELSILNGIQSIGSEVLIGCDDFSDLYYAGTQTQWQKISVILPNETLLGAVLHCDSLEETTPPVVQTVPTVPMALEEPAGSDKTRFSWALPQAR